MFCVFCASCLLVEDCCCGFGSRAVRRFEKQAMLDQYCRVKVREILRARRSRDMRVVAIASVNSVHPNNICVVRYCSVEPASAIAGRMFFAPVCGMYSGRVVALDMSLFRPRVNNRLSVVEAPKHNICFLGLTTWVVWTTTPKSLVST